MKNLLALVVLTATLLSGGVSAYAADPQPGFVTVPNCGVKSVLNMAHFMGREVTPVQTQTLCMTYPQERISMLDVSQAARSVGLDLEGQRIALDELESQRIPFIAVLPDHFVFVERVFSTWVRLSEMGESISSSEQNLSASIWVRHWC